MNHRMYAIAILPHVYLPDINGQRPEIWENDNEIVYFDSPGEARAQIAKWREGPIYLAHNEYAAPDYVVVDDETAEYVRSGRNEDASNYDWDGAECGCGECGACYRMMIEQDREYIRKHAR